MNVLFATSEAAPFIKTGGLGDVAGSLPVTLHEKGVDARVILPLYRCIPQHYKDQMRYIDHIYIDMAWRKQYCGVFELQHEGCTYYFLDNEFYFNGEKPYSYIHLDCEKFIFFSKAVLSILPTLGFRPDVIHCNDWQTGPIPVFLDTFLDNPYYRGIKTVMTVHNLQFQGRWDLKGIKDVMGISDYYFTPDKIEYYKDANLLKGGMVYANKISTVSETYAGEITTPEYGEGLDRLLAGRRNDLVGIVNGISYTEWNPETDPNIYEHYNKNSVLEKKKQNKIRLQQDLGLPVDENRMLIGIVSRLTDQKGFDLVAYAIEQLCAGGAQIVVLGTGDEKYENLFRHYAWKYPDRMSAQIYFSNEMSHKVYAASDLFLMPSRFEPCGLSQLISLRYGTLPLVRETGGLKDTVWPYNEFTGEGNGFSFAHYNADEMMKIVYYAMDIYYNNREAWNKIVQNAMEADFSWNVSADKYIHMYQDLTGIYDLPEKKTEKIVEEPSIEFGEQLRLDAAWSATEVAVKTDPEAAKAVAEEKKTPPKKTAKTAAPDLEKEQPKQAPVKRTRKTAAKPKEEVVPEKKTPPKKTAKTAAPEPEKEQPKEAPVKRTRKTTAKKETPQTQAKEPEKKEPAKRAAKKTAASTEEEKKQ